MSKIFCGLCAYHSNYKKKRQVCYYPFTERDIGFARDNGILLEGISLKGSFNCPHFNENEFIDAIKKCGWYNVVYNNRRSRKFR